MSEQVRGLAELFRERGLLEKSAVDTHGLFEWRTLADVFGSFPRRGGSSANPPRIRPGPRRTAAELIYSAESAADSASEIFIPPKKFLSDSASEAIGPTRIFSDFLGLNRSPPRNCSANYITSNDVLYGNLPKLSVKIKSRRLKLAGQCVRHPELLACDLVTWEPEAQRGDAKRGRPKRSYLSTLIKDVGTKTKEELRTLMRDRDLWRRISAIDRT